LTFRATISGQSNGDLLAPRPAGQDKGVAGEGLGIIVDPAGVPTIDIGDLVVPEGTNGQPLWGAPPQTTGFIAQTPLKLEKAKDSVDQVTINLADAKGKASFKVQWGTDVLTGAFDVK
jgi:hypothetical protein